MTTTTTDSTNSGMRLRLWPGVAIAIVQVLIIVAGPKLAPDAPVPIGFVAGVVGALAIFLWWIFFSRARWVERVGAIVLMIVAVLATKLIVHESMAGAGMGRLMYILPLPLLGFALVAWAAATRRFTDGVRRAALVAAIVLAVAPFVFIRTAGISGSGSEFHWRWTPTPEERLLARANDETPVEAPKEPVASAPAPEPAPTSEAAPAPEAAPVAAVPVAAKPEPAPALSEAPAEWPGFRGPNRDSVITGVRINTDWTQSPPVELWRRPIGPGWSSFAVRGDLLYTQEQRGEDEMVSAYRVSTGKPVWRHRDRVRFYESNGGPGPRGTPTLSHGRLYTFGATGILNALDPATGAVLWSRDVSAETKTKTPMWGFSASPLVVDDVVVVAASGTIAAYDLVTGKRRWVDPSRGGSYSSPHYMRISGVPQIVLLAGPGVMSVAPASGTLLWEHAWDGGAIVQPAVITESDILVSAMSMTGGTGTRRLAVTRGADGWNVKERWTSNGLKPYFNDYVVHKGHAYGFDGSILACINLEDGQRKWKGGRYGNGQLVLLPDQDLLLVLSEEGELALVGATTDQFKEVARFKVLDAKTWNHPVVVGNVLLVRNGEEMAAFRLP